MRTVRKPGDRRVQKTRALLQGALASLMHEKPYDAIVVKEILARANVGRSTFYAHFRDKDDLLERGIGDRLRRSERGSREGRSPGDTADPADRILRCSRALFEHIEAEIRQHRASGMAPADPQRWASVHQRVERALAELVGEALRHGDRRAVPDERDVPRELPRGLPRELLARHVAATFALVLRWWVKHGAGQDAATANALFRALILPAVARYG